MKETLIPLHGGYRKLKTFQLARLIYDLTVRFCELYIDPFSRTRDQMVQAARSGVQNIAEGSQGSGTSKKSELKLTNVARASLEELRLDYEDFLRQRKLAALKADDPILRRFKLKRCATLTQVQEWIAQERKIQSRVVSVGGRPCSSFSSAMMAANAALSLINLTCYLLDCQLNTQAESFVKEGGFTERMYKIRSRNRKPHQ